MFPRLLGGNDRAGRENARELPKLNREMDLRRVKDENKLYLCRTYYRGGFALLPFLWFINFLWFFREAFRREEFEQQKQIRTYVIRSLIGSLIWFSLMITWVVIFQLKRSEWGATADYMSFIIPIGKV